MIIRRKRTIKQSFTFLSMIIIVSTLQPIPVSANWNEEFSTSNLNGWYLWADDWNSNSGPVSVDPTWEIVDGELISKGEFNSWKWNHACRKIQVANGSWNFDHYWPDLGPADAQETITQVFLGQRNDYRNNKISKITGYEIRFNRRDIHGVSLDNMMLLVWNNSGSYALKSNMSYFEDNNFERGWQNIEVVRQDLITVRVNGNEILSLNSYNKDIGVLDEFCILATMGSNIKFDNIVASADPSLDFGDDFPMDLLFIAIAVVSGALLTIFYRNRKRKIRLLKMRKPPPSIDKILENKNKLQYFLFTINKELSEKKVAEPKFPTQLKKFRYLMNPIRMTIMKLLMQEYQVTSVEMKRTLDLTWAEYTNHVKSLKEMGILNIQEQFVDGDVRQVVYLEEHGKRSFLELKGLLVELLEDSELFLFDEEDELYPTK